MKWFILILVVFTAGMAFVIDLGVHYRLAHAAMENARFGEHVIQRQWASYCPVGYASFAFIAHETQGYVCTSWFSDPIVRETQIDPRIGLNWH